MDRATQLGVVTRPTKSGRPNQWKTQPQSMLVARATAEAARLIAADAILGIGYAAEEISDGVDTITPPAEPKAATKTRRMSLPKPQAEDIPAGVKPAPDTTPQAQPTTEAKSSHPEAGAAPAGITTAQRTKLMALFNGIGITDRAERLNASAVIVNRQIGSANHLTLDEAHALIDVLETVSREKDPKGALAALLAEAAKAQIEETFDAEIIEGGE